MFIHVEAANYLLCSAKGKRQENQEKGEEKEMETK